MRAIIPVAGVGARLRPFTYSLPKVLLNVAGKPILGHILDALQENNVDKVTIITGYKGDLVEQYVNTHYHFHVDYCQQTEQYGLGHAIWTARETFEDEPLMIILGDTIFDADLKSVSESKYCSIGVKEVSDPRRFGVVVHSNDGFINKLIEKPETPVSNLAIVGIYYISNPSLLRTCLEKLIDEDIRTRDEYQLTDALQLMLNNGEKFTSFNVDGWYDCGKPETMLSTNRILLEKMNTNNIYSDAIIIPPVYIAPTAHVETSVIGPFASIAEGAVVRNSIIKDSIISENSRVEQSLLDRSIIGNNAVVKGQFFRLNVGDSSEIKYA
ncbi:MAG: sugar phosphate nucleotidyltransferase [Candidatus Kapabacteria bacterium]|nr:sugar phosphate nucleotidyltransferase [Candidatus Kapabacteria bacterium]